MGTLPISLQKYFQSDIIERSFIEPDCLDTALARTCSACESRSLQEITRFIAEHPALAEYPLLQRRRVVQRALLFATESLGTDHSLTSEQLTEKSALHLFMSVKLTALWLLDDTLDVDSSIEGEVASQIIEYYLELLEPSGEPRIDAQLLQAACSRHDIPGRFVEALTLLLRWQHALALAVGISLDSSSIYSRLNRKLMRGYLHAHSMFDSLEGYFLHRSESCGLGVVILCGARWLCRLWGVDHSGLEIHQAHYDAMILKYSLLGGLSNDLFGYDKDLKEGVATSVEVVKQHITTSRADDEDEQVTMRAFTLLIDHYNRGLAELAEAYRTCDSPLERAVLAASLSVTWTIRVLHHEFMMIYQPGWLRKVLAARGPADPGGVPGEPAPRAGAQRPAIVSNLSSQDPRRPAY